MPASKIADAYWSLSKEELFARLQSRPAGLTTSEAALRLKKYGRNALEQRREVTVLGTLLSQFRSPLVLILIVAAGFSAAFHEWLDAAVVLAVVFGSTALGFYQEWRAGVAIERLRAHLALRATVFRDGKLQSVLSDEVVPGDVVSLSAGSLIPADAVLLEAKDFFVSQAVLTGETFPVEKSTDIAAADAGLAGRTNVVFLGTSVRSGTARALVVQTGASTEFSRISARLSLRPPETEFERGISRFGALLMRVMLAIVVVIFAANIFLAKPPIDSLLFAIALAVGLTPELLPAIITVTLARGAQEMAERGVIVRRLNAIENFGAMDVFCTDKTGTLTQGVVRLDLASTPDGKLSPRVLDLSFVNAALQAGLPNPLDEAIVGHAKDQGVDRTGWVKLDEVPYDFVRKRLSVVALDPRGQRYLITKGAPEKVLDICTSVRDGAQSASLDQTRRQRLEECYRGWNGEGFRVLGVASRVVPEKKDYSREDERELCFEGFLRFFDPPKAGVDQEAKALAGLGVQIKVVTGDSREVAVHLAREIGLPIEGVLTGAELSKLHDEALWHLAGRTTIFAEVDPNQKERIILALRKTGHVVGYIGDGINDAPALHAADVGISVDSAVDVAKEAADLVLLRRGLDVLRAGIVQGRKTFINTLKYIFMTTSANFGNMFSMAGASLWLPFLPLLAKQILLNNFLSDVPAMAIADDNVDPELIERPRRWDAEVIGSFMVLFGLVSSVFDFVTFAYLYLVLHAAPDLFRTGWFVESLLTELFVTFVIRTRRPLTSSRPGTMLTVLTIVVTALALLIPYMPLFRNLFQFVKLPGRVLLVLLGITALYVLTCELLKRRFFRWSDARSPGGPATAKSGLA